MSEAHLNLLNKLEELDAYPDLVVEDLQGATASSSGESGGSRPTNSASPGDGIRHFCVHHHRWPTRSTAAPPER